MIYPHIIWNHIGSFPNGTNLEQLRMGYMRHHAIVITSWDEELIEKAHSQARGMFPWVSMLSDKGINGQVSFFVPPDGSKENWPESSAGDLQRKAFLDWCDAQAYDDGSNSLAYVEVFFGDDNKEAGVTRES